MDVKTTFDFENFYQNGYKNELENYYDMLRGKRLSNILLKCGFSVLLSIVLFVLSNSIHLKTILNEYYGLSITAYFVGIILLTIFSIKKSLRKEIYSINEQIIEDIIAFISDNNVNNIMYEPKKMVSREFFEQMELFNLDVVKYNGRNYIKAPYRKNNMVFSDMETFIIDTIESKKEIYKNGKKYIRTTRKKKKRIIFKGIYIGATLNKKNANQIYLIPNNLNDTVLQSKIMNYIQYHGTSVNLENLEFSKKYKVFCDDEVQARYILSLSLMERINKLDELYSGKKYIVFKEGKRFAICIEGITIDDIKKEKLPIFRNENTELKRLTNMFSKLNNLFSIYYILDLGNDLYTKYIDKPVNNATNLNNINKTNYATQQIQEKRIVLSNREKLIKSFQLPQNVRQLNSEDIIKVLKKSILNVNNVIHNISVETENYMLSNRQIATKNNALSNIKSNKFIDAYYEIEDFVDDYGNKHEGKVYEKEKNEIISLLQLLENGMNQRNTINESNENQNKNYNTWYNLYN